MGRHRQNRSNGSSLLMIRLKTSATTWKIKVSSFTLVIQTEKKSPAECSISPDSTLTIFGPLSRYFLTIQIAFDYNGCDQGDKTDWNEYREGGIDFAEYGAKKCKKVFMDKVVKQCKQSLPISAF